MEKKNNLLKRLYKSNSFIESSYNLSLSEHRLLSLACTKVDVKIDKNMTEKQYLEYLKEYKFKLITISISDYINTFNINDKGIYEEMKNICDKFWEQTLYIKKEGSLIKKRLVITSEYKEDEKTISIKFHPDLVEHLLILKDKYSSSQLGNIYGFKCKYSFKAYDLMTQYMKISNRSITLDDYRFYLGLKETEYTMFSALKKYVLDKTTEEINTKTNLIIDYEITKTSRKVTGLNFKIRVKKIVSQTEGKNELSPTKEDYIKIKGILEEYQSEISDDDIKNLFCKANGDINLIDKQYNIVKYFKGKKSIIAVLMDAIKNPTKYKLPKGNKNQGTFNSYSQRKYNFDNLEKNLLGTGSGNIYEDSEEVEEQIALSLDK